MVFILGLAFSPRVYSQLKSNFKLPSGPEGPGKFGAYYTYLKYRPEWDSAWRVAEHPDIVVLFEDGGHKFVFWRGTSYIPCWVTSNGIWYTNEFVERRGWHNANTDGCVEPMSDKQCRYSQVRIIESTEARVVVHWRYAPVDVQYRHPFIDTKTGWYDWVDEYYVIYPNATGIRDIRVQSTNVNKWMEFQEAIVINQHGTLPQDNIETGAISVANMNGENITYNWDKEPDFRNNPEKANIFTVNLKSEKRPFALVVPPQSGNNLITSYGGHGRNSIFNWWDHWPVSQDASDGRDASSAERPSHSSLCHIGLNIDPPIDCKGTDGYETVIRDSQLYWTSTEYSTLKLGFSGKFDMTDSVLVEFDYTNLWSDKLVLTFFDDEEGTTKAILLNDKENGLILNDKKRNTFSKKFYLPAINENAVLKEILGANLNIAGAQFPQTMILDNIRIIIKATSPKTLNFSLNFNFPDGSLIEKLNMPEKSQWEPYSQVNNMIRKIMVHGLTSDKIENLVPLAKSWTEPAELVIKGNDFTSMGYDPTQMAYKVNKDLLTSKRLDFELNASADKPMITPAFVIENWGSKEIEVRLNGKTLVHGVDYKAGFVDTLEGTKLILWIDKKSENKVSFSITAI
jgi:hypothetical protein